MYQIAYIGRWDTLPETAAAICDQDTPKLEALLQGGLDLDVICMTPTSRQSVIFWLIPILQSANWRQI